MASSRPVQPSGTSLDGSPFYPERIPRDRNEFIGRVLGGRYLLRSAIGTGASAHVYLADDTSLKRQVAVKVLHPALAGDEQFLKRFRAEAQAVASLRHPNIMGVFDWGQEDTGPYLVLEYLAGGSLRSLLDSGHRLTPSQALLLGLETARALDHAHRRGLVHRDIKPANLLFDDEGRLSVADFGLARALAEATWTEPMGAVLGTARYASPEQAQGSSLDGKGDIYSLALVLYEAVTGVVPFSADTTLATLMGRVGKRVIAPESLGPLGPVVEAATHPDPASRPDAAGLGRLLANAARTLPRPEALPIMATVGESAVGDDVVGEDMLSEEAASAPDDITVIGRIDLRPHASGAAGSGAAGSGGGGFGGQGGGPAVAGPGMVFDAAKFDSDPVVVPRVGRPGAGTHRVAVARVTLPMEWDPTDQPGADAGHLYTDDRADDRAADKRRAGVDWADGEDFGGGNPNRGGGRGRRRRGVLDGAAVGRRRRRWPKVALAVLVFAAIGAGAGAYELNAAKASHPVPALTDKTLAQARAALDPLALRVGVGASQFDEVVPRDAILGQSIAAGVKRKEGSTIVVTLSLGPAPRDVPDLTGKSQGDALDLVQRAGFVPVVAAVTSQTVPAGAVVDWSPKGRQEKGVTVNVTVSSGKPTHPVPSLAGKAPADVEAALRALGFVPARGADAFSDTVPTGQVISTNPAAGVSVAEGDKVAYTVSKGPDTVVIPTSVIGKTYAEAVSILQAAGLQVAGPFGPNGAARVVNTAPSPGAKVKRGTTVNVYLA